MIAEKLIHFLESKGVECHPFNSVLATSWTDILTSDKIPFENTARTDILRENDNIYLAIIPAGYKLDLERLNRCLNRRLELVPSEEARTIMKDCEEGTLPPLGDLYRYPTFIDRSFETMDEVYFVVGQFSTILRLSGEDFMSLQTSSMQIANLTQEVRVVRSAREAVVDEPLCAEPATEEAATEEIVIEEPVEPDTVALEVVETPSAAISLGVDLEAHREGFRQRLTGIDRLPVMPHMAHDILQLRTNMYANASDLASVVEMDPSLAAQVVRYANSPMYGYQGKILTIQDAIARVLGYDVVMDMALGVTLGKSLNMPTTGPLGMNSYWQHAIHAAALTHRLSKRMEMDNKPQPGAAYLCGLLHDFGFLVLGHLFKDDFELLSRLIVENPEKPLVELEQSLLGMTHEEIGAWLSEAWNMPRAVTIAIREHHNIDYDGDYAVLANLVLVADRLLKSYDTAGATDTDITPAILNRLGLTIDKVLEEYKAFIIERDDLDAIALQIAA